MDSTRVTAAAPAREPRQLPESGYVTMPLSFPKIFSPDECDAILELGRPGLAYRSAQARPVEGQRSALTFWMEHGTAETRFIEDRFDALLAQVNRFYGFDLAGYRDPFLLCTYQPGDGFDWHLDMAERTTSTRKLSISVQLSDPADYEGGGLEFMLAGEIPFSRSRGSVVVFPAYLCHRVSPVIRGSRSSLVWWAHGPTFR